MTTVKLFKASWCGYCRAFKNEWELFKRASVELGIETETLDIDNEDHKDEFKKEGVQGYPTIKIYKNGKSTTYRGERSAEGLLTEII